MQANVSLFRRFGAIVYDLLLAFSLVFFVFFIAIIVIFDGSAQGTDMLFYLITAPVTYSYFALSWTIGRQTLGMKAWKFQVTQYNKQNITHKQAFIRFTLSIISFIFIGLGFVYQLFNKNNLAWHDEHSKTILIRL